MRVSVLRTPRRVQRLMDLSRVRAKVATEAAVYLLINNSGTPQSPEDLARAAAVADS